MIAAGDMKATQFGMSAPGLFGRKSAEPSLRPHSRNCVIGPEHERGGLQSHYEREWRGFGLGWYGEHSEPALYRQTRPA